MALQSFSETATLPRSGRGVSRGCRAGLQTVTARVLSHVASPPVLAAACVFTVAAADGRPTAILAAAVFTLVGTGLPVLALVKQWRSGQITDLEITRREERLWPMLLTATCVGLGAGLLQVFGAPSAVAGMASILGVISLLLLAVTTRWKISVHCAAAATAATLVWVLVGRFEPGLVLVAAVVWSRLHLRRHSVWQCLAGAGVGTGMVLLFWPLLGA